jgi:DNA replication protein DnaC
MRSTGHIDLDKTLSNLKSTIAKSYADCEKFLSALPASKGCDIHPHFARTRDDQKTWQAQKAIFAPCELCVAAARQQAEIEKLNRMGVPLNLCGATFENWTPADEREEANREKVRDFLSARRGFLILLGGLGTGKSHLAVAAFRHFGRGLFIKQSELLRRLRQTYRDKAAIDPVEEAQNVACLVLDEMGLSPGGRDELPLLHDVLDYRHGNKKPTILTGNLMYDELRGVIGERMADRLRESAFAVLNFGGASRRAEARDKYFPNQQSE